MLVGCSGRTAGYESGSETSSTDGDTSSSTDGGTSGSTDDETTDEPDDDETTDETSDTDDPIMLEPPVLELSFSTIKQFDFSWSAVPGAEHYQLLESSNAGEPFVQLGDDIVGESISISMPLHLRAHARYELRACNADGCSESSASVDVASNLAEAVGYLKPGLITSEDRFGSSVALSDDGTTLAVGVPGAEGLLPNAGLVLVFRRIGVDWYLNDHIYAFTAGENDMFGLSVALSEDGRTLAIGVAEDGGATGIGGDPLDDAAPNAGAVWVFEQDDNFAWQQTYIKASNTDAGDSFGSTVALSDDGNTLAVGASSEDSHATGIDGDQSDDSSQDAGAVYVFARDGGVWSQQAYVKASNTGAGDSFGQKLALSGDGNSLAVSAYRESSNATGIDGDQTDDSSPASGAVYVFVRNNGAWSQEAYVKSSNTGESDQFGYGMALSKDGNTLAVGALGEDGGMFEDDPLADAGAAYLFARNNGLWSQQARITASNIDDDDFFGLSVALSSDGDILAVGARLENSSAIGIDGDQTDGNADSAGAVYMFVRNGADWSQRAYVKASNSGAGDWFGETLALSGDGAILAVGAVNEDSSATSIGGDQADNAAPETGAVYLY